MRGNRKVSRRTLLRGSAALGAISPFAASGCLGDPREDAPAPAARAQLSRPLAQEFTIAAHVPSDGSYSYIHDPGMAVLPRGRLLVAAPVWTKLARESRDEWTHRTLVSVSDDRGKSWRTIATLPHSDATPFVHDGRLYMFVQDKQWQNWSIVSSDDGGATFSEPVTLFEGVYWNCDTSMVVDRGRLIWALQSGKADWTSCDLVVVACDLTKDPKSKDAWSMSAPLAIRPTPRELDAGLPRFGWNADAWLEPNVVKVGGKLRVLLRAIIDGYATANVAVVCDVDEDDAGHHLRFAQLAALPGGQNKFTIAYDERSKLFWMASNLAADPQGAVFDWERVRREGHFANGPGNDRRFLMLFYSVDALSWFPAGCIARADQLRQSFMYPAMRIDGDDLVVIARSSLEGFDQHDADAVTFHRVERFRELAMNLWPAGDPI